LAGLLPRVTVVLGRSDRRRHRALAGACCIPITPFATMQLADSLAEPPPLSLFAGHAFSYIMERNTVRETMKKMPVQIAARISSTSTSRWLARVGIVGI